MWKCKCCGVWMRRREMADFMQCFDTICLDCLKWSKAILDTEKSP